MSFCGLFVMNSMLAVNAAISTANGMTAFKK
jgi:hypothetical protein